MASFEVGQNVVQKSLQTLMPTSGWNSVVPSMVVALVQKSLQTLMLPSGWNSSLQSLPSGWDASSAQRRRSLQTLMLPSLQSLQSPLSSAQDFPAHRLAAPAPHETLLYKLVAAH